MIAQGEANRGRMRQNVKVYCTDMVWPPSLCQRVRMRWRFLTEIAHSARAFRLCDAIQTVGKFDTP